MKALPVYLIAKLLLWATSYHRNPVWIYVQGIGWFKTYATMAEFVRAAHTALHTNTFISTYTNGRLTGALNPHAVTYAQWWPRRARP